MEPKKRSVGASERDEFLRAAWRLMVAGEIHAERLVFVDECSTNNTSLAPLYAWSRRGERAFCSLPRNWGANVTLLASMSVGGMGPCLTVEGPTTREVFETYLERALAPSLRACLESNRVGLGGAESAPFTRGQPHVSRFCAPASSVFEAFLPKRALRQLLRVRQRMPNRLNPHLYQTGSYLVPVDVGRAAYGVGAPAAEITTQGGGERREQESEECHYGPRPHGLGDLLRVDVGRVALCAAVGRAAEGTRAELSGHVAEGAEELSEPERRE